MATKEDLILSTIDGIVTDMKELRKESKEQSASLQRLEGHLQNQKDRCTILHSGVDDKLSTLSTYVKSHEIQTVDDLKKKATTITDWKTWAVRLLVTVPVSIITAVVVVFLKGCG